LETAEEHGKKSSPRNGKTVYTGSIYREKCNRKIRIVFKVTERKILADGQVLLTPDIEVQTWWTSLENSEEDVIKLYCEHATCEQFHSEMKTDIGLERLPSSHFATNALVLRIAVLAFNILRIIGQTALSFGTKLTRHDVQRLRAKTVIQRFITIAAHVTNHARQIILNIGRSNLWNKVFIKLYTAFA